MIESDPFLSATPSESISFAMLSSAIESSFLLAFLPKLSSSRTSSAIESLNFFSTLLDRIFPPTEEDGAVRPAVELVDFFYCARTFIEKDPELVFGISSSMIDSSLGSDSEKSSA